MSDQVRQENGLSSESRSATQVEAVNSAACKMQRKGWLKEFLPMTICCAVPLLLVGAIALFGISLGALTSGFMSLAAVLACPVAMYLMMRMMMKKK